MDTCPADLTTILIPALARALIVAGFGVSAEPRHRDRLPSGTALLAQDCHTLRG